MNLNTVFILLFWTLCYSVVGQNTKSGTIEDTNVGAFLESQVIFRSQILTSTTPLATRVTPSPTFTKALPTTSFPSETSRHQKRGSWKRRKKYSSNLPQIPESSTLAIPEDGPKNPLLNVPDEFWTDEKEYASDDPEFVMNKYNLVTLENLRDPLDPKSTEDNSPAIDLNAWELTDLAQIGKYFKKRSDLVVRRMILQRDRPWNVFNQPIDKKISLGSRRANLEAGYDYLITREENQKQARPGATLQKLFEHVTNKAMKTDSYNTWMIVQGELLNPFGDSQQVNDPDPSDAGKDDKSPFKDDDIPYIQSHSLVDSAIVIKKTRRDLDTNSRPAPWADLLWWSWITSCMQDRPELKGLGAVSTPEGSTGKKIKKTIPAYNLASAGDLNYILIEGVNSGETEDIFDLVADHLHANLRDRKNKKKGFFRVSEDGKAKKVDGIPLSDPRIMHLLFYMLLGTPHIRECERMLVENANSLDRKQIKYIDFTFGETENGVWDTWHIMLTLERVKTSQIDSKSRDLMNRYRQYIHKVYKYIESSEPPKKLALKLTDDKDRKKRYISVMTNKKPLKEDDFNPVDILFLNDNLRRVVSTHSIDPDRKWFYGVQVSDPYEKDEELPAFVNTISTKEGAIIVEERPNIKGTQDIGLAILSSWESTLLATKTVVGRQFQFKGALQRAGLKMLRKLRYIQLNYVQDEELVSTLKAVWLRQNLKEIGNTAAAAAAAKAEPDPAGQFFRLYWHNGNPSEDFELLAGTAISIKIQEIFSNNLEVFEYKMLDKITAGFYDGKWFFGMLFQTPEIYEIKPSGDYVIFQ